MRNSCNAGWRPVAAVLLRALILTGTLIWNCIAAVPPAAADPITACGPDQATAVQSAISQMPPPQIAATIPDARWSSQVWSPDSNYDPCADLSTVLITTERATVTGPRELIHGE